MRRPGAGGRPPLRPGLSKLSPAGTSKKDGNPAAPAQSTRVEIVLAAAAALLGALIFVLAGPYSNFASPGYIDPWFYTGYFTNFSYLLKHYGVTYYVSRLPWIIPGCLAFRLASPHIASILLNAVLVATSVLSLYWTIRWYYGRFPAVAASLSLGTNLYFFSTVAWDYPDGPAIAYALGAVAFAVRPGGRRSVNTILSGALFALAGYTNMAAGPIILGGLIIGAWRYRRSIRGLVSYGVWLGTAVACTTLILCLVGKRILGRYDFYQPQLDQTHLAFANPGFLANMWGTGNAFLLSAYRLFPVVFLLVAGAFLLARRKTNRFLAPCYWFLLASTLLYAYQEFVLHGVALRVAYHSCYIVVPLFTLAGAVIGELWNRTGSQRLPVWSFGALAAFTLCQPYLRKAWTPPGLQLQLWIAMAVIGASAIGLMVWRQSRPIVPSVLVILLVFWGPGVDQSLADPLSRGNAETFDSMMAAENWIKSTVPPDREVRFWFDGNEPASPLFNGISALYLWRNWDLTTQLPTTDAGTVRYYITPQTVLVHLTMDPAKITARLRMLEARGIRVANERRFQRQGGGHMYYVVLHDVNDTSGIH